jgi:signal peptidase I
MEAVLSDLVPETMIPPEPLEAQPIPSEGQETPPEQPDKWKTWRGFLRDTLETLGLAIILFLVINAISARVRVDGFSMRPTLDDGQYVLVNRMAYRLGQPERGDIIVFRPPVESHEDYIKRIIGLPGDSVEINNGSVYVNGVIMSEAYIAAPPAYSGNWVVPAGNLFVLGDNRNNSSDSHSWGMLPVENILGRAILVYWPFADWSVLGHYQAVAAPP